nr:ferritin-like fold-containing protein [Jiangella gansuensis]
MSSSGAFDDPVYRDGIVDLLGVLGLGELTGFERMAADAGLAPTLADKAALAGMAVTEFHHFELIRDRLDELGASVDEAMAPFRDAYEQFHANTAPSDWLEGLVKAYVGDGIAADFYREVAERVDPATRGLVREVLAEAGHGDFAIERVRDAIAADPKVAGRLALWARRLVGEALAQAQRVAVDRDALLSVIVGGDDGRAGMDLAEMGQLFARITKKHSDRMTKLGLSA